MSAGLRWDDLAAEQGRIYQELVGGKAVPTSAPDPGDQREAVQAVVPLTAMAPEW